MRSIHFCFVFIIRLHYAHNNVRWRWRDYKLKLFYDSHANSDSCDRIEWLVSTSRCCCDNPGLNPGHGISGRDPWKNKFYSMTKLNILTYKYPYPQYTIRRTIYISYIWLFYCYAVNFLLSTIRIPLNITCQKFVCKIRK